jgi:hypothetical protein
MKRNIIKFILAPLIFLINLFLFQNMSAQNYQPVLKTDSTSWTIAHQELFGIVVDVFYTNTFQDSTFSHVYSNDLYYPYIGKLRENAVEGKLWFTQADSNVEYLIMDMSLQIGDTFEIKPGLWSQVDSIYYLDEKKVIQFDLFSSRWNEPIRFIEGAGPNNDFSLMNDFDWFYMTCKYDHDILDYVNQNSLFIGCMPDPTGVKEKSDLKNEITFYPNPCSGTLNINISNFNMTKISIIDLYGRVLNQIYLQNASNLINLNDLTNGVYFIKAEVGNSVSTKTIIRVC